MSLFVGSFSFSSDAGGGTVGQFDIVVDKETMHKAEQAFRAKIRKYFSQEPDFHPVSVFLLDIIKIDDVSQPTMILLKKEHGPIERKPVFFSPLPMSENHAESWTASMPDDKELFLLID